MCTPTRARGITLRARGLFVVLLIAATAVSGSDIASDQRVLGVAEVIETTRAMVDGDLNAVFVSPDARRYAVMLITGDIVRDGVHAQILVGDLHSLEAATPRVVARLFTRGLGDEVIGVPGAQELTVQGLNVPRWLDERRVALLWEDERGVRQVLAIDVDSGQREWLTRHPTHVLYYSTAPNAQVLYGAIASCAPPPAHHDIRGFSVQANEGWLPFDACGLFARRNHALFLTSGAAPRPLALGESSINRFEIGGDALPLISPDGRYAIAWMSVHPTDLEPEWRSYRNSWFADMLEETRAGLDTLAARQLRRLVLIDMRSARVTALLGAPAAPRRLSIQWSPDSTRVALARVFAPMAQGRDEAALTGYVVLTVDVRSAEVQRAPLALEVAQDVMDVRWLDAKQIEITLREGEAITFTLAHGKWRRTAAPRSRAIKKVSAPLRIELRQDLNAPPVLHAVEEGSARERRLLDLNPQLRTFTLGRVEWLEFQDKRFGAWRGRLYYPVDFEPGRRYPLVVQTHTAAAKEEFSLSGKGGTQPALGPGVSAYIAQPLANRGFFVLHGERIEREGVGDDVESTRLRIEATEHVIEALVARGWVAREKVGLMGFSASGWLVTYAISHSTFPYAAALTDDNKDGGYLQASLANWSEWMMQDPIGAPAFGEGLHVWLRESPAFNVERIHTPLLLSVSSPGLELGAWELFSRLRYLKRPVEFYVIPKIRRGGHTLQNPTQLRALQERALDWWCFWLKNEEDPDPAKAQQYREWSVLRDRSRN